MDCSLYSRLMFFNLHYWMFIELPGHGKQERESDLSPVIRHCRPIPLPLRPVASHKAIDSPNSCSSDWGENGVLLVGGRRAGRRSSLADVRGSQNQEKEIKVEDHKERKSYEETTCRPLFFIRILMHCRTIIKAKHTHTHIIHVLLEWGRGVIV